MIDEYRLPGFAGIMRTRVQPGNIQGTDNWSENVLLGENIYAKTDTEKE